MPSSHRRYNISTGKILEMLAILYWGTGVRRATCHPPGLLPTLGPASSFSSSRVHSSLHLHLNPQPPERALGCVECTRS